MEFDSPDDVSVRKLTLAALPLALLLSACIDDNEQIGVSVRAGRPMVVYVPCAGGGGAATVRLLIPNGQVIGDDDDEILWRIDATPDAARAFLAVVGDAPRGSRTVVPLRRDLPPELEIALYIQNVGGGDGAVSFTPAELREGSIITDGSELLSADEFLARDKEGCGGALEPVTSLPPL